MEDFIRKKIAEDLKQNKVTKVHTRFPPEPNGYLHIGHAKSIVLNFSVADEFDGLCNLRFDDTNPEKENTEYVEAIKEDVKWLGFNWEDRLYFTSSYFQKLYECAKILIQKNLAYVDHSSAEEIKNLRGTLTEAGKNSSYRNRSVEENLQWFEKMKSGECEEGECLLRAKIDMAHPNIVMRDPAIYRIRKATHHRTGNEWCIYPMYDFAHCISDAIEKITHSLCTLEFEIHRPLYNWFVESVGIFDINPQQIEFSRLELTHTLMSKRILKKLVDEKIVTSWNDPRLPTISGLRRRGYTPAAIKKFCKSIGVTKVDARLEIQRLEESLRNDLNKNAHRLMVVENPLKVVITNYPDDTQEFFDAENLPENVQDENTKKDFGTHKVGFSKIIYIEKNDFLEDAPKKFFRLSLGKEVRLKYAYYITCTNIVKDEHGNVIEVHATYDPASRGGGTADGRKVKGTLHWVSERDCEDIVIHNYDRLFNTSIPNGDNLHECLSENSFSVSNGAKAESYIKSIIQKAHINNEQVILQFLRKGYYAYDTLSSNEKQSIVFNSTVSLKDSFNK